MTTQETMSLRDHLAELRNRLIVSVIALGVGAIIGFFFWQEVFDLLAAPYEAAVDQELAAFSVTEPFSIAMRISFFTGAVLASPIIIYEIWRFISPALTHQEKRYVIPASAVLAALFLGGILLGYVAIERGLDFLVNFGEGRLFPVIGVDNYLRFAVRFLFAFGVAFEFPVFLFMAAALGAVTSKKLRANRRWAVLIILVSAALITPSGDPLTLMLMSVPLYLLYEATILAIRFILHK